MHTYKNINFTKNITQIQIIDRVTRESILRASYTRSEKRRQRDGFEGKDHQMEQIVERRLGLSRFSWQRTRINGC